MQQKYIYILPNIMLCFIIITGYSQTTLNVTDFGAVGDAVQFYGNTVSNSVVITTTNVLSVSDIGKSIQVFDAGEITTAPECQDMVATITNVVDGTNIYANFISQRTLTNTFITVGTDNRTALQSAINAASGTNVTINIPEGNYLILSEYEALLYATVGIHFNKGGLHFQGQGTDKTVLLGKGAWQIRAHDGKAARGFMIAMYGGITNDYPMSFHDLTMDGGIPNGFTLNNNFPASTVTGDGWDETHSAFDIRSGVNPRVTFQTWSNVLVRHWRGEMLKSNDTDTNGFLTLDACRFEDGNATAINIYYPLTITNCVFHDLSQIGEYYQAWAVNPSLFINNTASNIYRTGFAINGARSNSPSFTFTGNQFFLSNTGYGAIITTPGVNIYITSNLFQYPAGSPSGAFAFGSAGYQGYWWNSNIIVSGNTFVNSKRITIISGAVDSTGVNRVEGVKFFNNTAINGPSESALVYYGWATNVHYYSNVFQTNTQFAMHSDSYGSQFAKIDLSNDYFSALYDLVGTNNFVSYGNGSRQRIIYGFLPNTQYILVTTNASRIPSGAQLLIENENTSGSNAPIYLNSEMTHGPVYIPAGESKIFNWNSSKNKWQLPGTINTTNVNIGVMRTN